MAVAAPTPSTDAQKAGKTKAKSRYLKKKKERRKHRKVETAYPKQSAAPVAENEDGNDEGGASSGEEETTLQTVNVKEPPRKRRKVDTDEEGARSTPPSSESDGDEEEPVPVPFARSPTPPTALPSFPLPIAPDAPSKTTLALQGLDKALLGAEVVNPSTSVSIDALDAERVLNTGVLPVVSEKMRKRLRELGINEFFAVQTALLPFLLPPQRRSRALYCPYDPPRDVCASAPTGSGKTLAYVIPIVEILSSRIATRLRALIVIPTRDLVLQVQETFEAVSKGRGLKIGVATGQHSFVHEQTQLVSEQGKTLQGGSSKVDILICTPGRLMDHLAGTPGFTLQHLRFLVIDEADRLLAQSFQDWLAQVLAALRPPTRSTSVDGRPSVSTPTLEFSSGPSLPTSPFLIPPSTSVSNPIPHHDALAPPFLPHIATDVDDPKHASCQKLLFSATLTRDPARISALGLRDAKYFVVQGRSGENADGEDAVAALGTEEFAMPEGLKEHYLTIPSARKPLVLFHLVHAHGVSNALVFTKSSASTARLVKLFEFFEEAYRISSANADAANAESGSLPGLAKRIVAQAYSSDLAPGERKTILEKFKRQEIDILICSDLVARGLDIPYVAHVVSYDSPVDARKYVHRAGRTARAGRAGDAWTLVEDQEAHFFKNMLRGAGRLERVARERVKEKDLEGMEKCYEIALEKLREAYSRTTS